MEFLPLLPFMAVSVPESFVLYFLGTTLFGYKPQFFRLITAAFVTSLASYLVRSMPLPFGAHTFAQVVLMVILFRAALGIPYLLAIITTFLSAFILGFAESISIPSFGWIFGVSLKEIISSPPLRFLFAIPHFTVLTGITYLLRRRDWYLRSLRKTLTGNVRDMKPGQARRFYLFAISLMQAMMLILLNVSFYIYSAEVFQTFRLSSLVLLTSLIMIASAIITVFVANRLLEVTNRETRLEAEMNHLKEMQNLNLKIRSQRHDFYNHITSMYGFIRSGRYEDAKNYMESLYQEVRQVKGLLEIEPPALGALLSLKREKAHKLGVELSWNLEMENDPIPLSTQELTQVLGNLLDNAIEAAEKAEKKTVKMSLENSSLGLSMDVVNTSRPIPKEEVNNMLKAGYTTKDTVEHGGLGLYIVKEVVNRHKGELIIDKGENYPGLEIHVFIPGKSAH